MAKKASCSSSLAALFFLFLFSKTTFLAVAQNNTTIPVHVGLVLDFDALHGKMGLSCIEVALSDFYASNPNYKTRLVLDKRSSPSDVVVTTSAAFDLIKNVQVQAIIGHASPMQFLICLGEKAQVPIISYSATSPSLTSIRSSYFIRAAQNDSCQVKAISAIIHAFGWAEVVPIYVDDEFGEEVIPYLSDALHEVDARIGYRSVIPPAATDDQIVVELEKLMAMQTRVFVVHMSPSLGLRIFDKAKEIGMMEAGCAWIMTDWMTNKFSTINSSGRENMQGVLGIKTYYPNSKALEYFRAGWKRKFQQDNPTVQDAKLDVFGLWAYDAAWALAMAAEKVGAKNFSFEKKNTSGKSSTTDPERFGVSQNGPQLIQELSGTNFKGLSGDFNLSNGQLQSSTFEIVNVIGSGEKLIGFWTPKNGLSRNLNLRNTSKYSISNASLGSIIWPGDTTSAPKGWQIPTLGTKLRILVPVEIAFREFVNVTHDPITNTTMISGYCIDVFDAVIEALPYPVPYELIPYAMPNGSSAGTYNDMVYEVYLKKYDAAVGDITIRANRSLYVDFTLPYTESGVSMIVPIKDNKSKNAWVFLKPLTWDLWVTSGCFFIFIGFVVWLLEHRINEAFRGPPHHQIGTSFWFSFSTMVFSPRERVVSNLARFVVIIWCFVVLILTQSYTASLTSLLTVQRLQPTVTDVNLLLKNGDNVACERGSFVHGILKQLGFPDDKLKAFGSPEELHQLFQNGSKKDGISAAFDENPYMKLFLAKYCSKYTMVEPRFKADGFGFVFPKGSPLAHDVSRAILNVNEGDKMKKIEKKWFNKESSCPDPNSLVSSNSLSLESFWGLFLIAGLVSTLALLIYAAMFLYEHKEILSRLDPKASLWRKFCVVLRIYDEKDLKSFTFKKGEPDVNTIFPPSPSVYSNNTESRMVFDEQMRTPSSY